MGYRKLAIAVSGVLVASLSGAHVYAQQTSDTDERSPAASTSSPGATTAESAAPGAVAEIIVTARKRSEALQDVPVSVTAVSASTIERNNIVEIDQVGALTPNVIFKPADPGLPILSAYIRGIGERGGEPSQDHPIASSLDGVYLTGISGSLIDIFDVQQIEVLRGPQGTLQGRNSPGGAINVTTRRPSGQFGARAEVSYGRFNEVHARGSMEAPLLENVLAAKVAVFRNSGGNFMTNILTDQKQGGRDDWGARLGFLYTPTSNVKAYLTTDYSKDTSPPSALRAVPHAGARGPYEPETLVCTAYGFCNPVGKYNTDSEYNVRNNIRNFGATLNVDIDLGPATLTSVTGYRDVDEILNIDIDTLPVEFLEYRNRRNHSDSASEELRIASNGATRLSYVAGAIVSRYKFNLLQPVLIGTALTGLPAPITQINARSQTADSYAVFGQAVFKITDQWSVTGGLRKTNDYKKALVQPTVPGPSGEFKASFNNLSAEAGTEYHFAGDKLAYFRFSQGYRAGGINSSASELAAVNSYRPETVNAYEIGLKTEWLNRTLTANLSAFIYNYRDFQVLEVQPFSGGFTSRIGSADGLRIKGMELETNIRPLESLTLTGSIGYLDAKYKSQILDLGFGVMNLDTFRKDNAPKWTAYFSFDYDVPVSGGNGSVTFGGDVSYKSTTLTVPVDSPIGIQSGYALLGGSITYRTEDKKYSVSLFGQNLTNRYYKEYGEQINGLVAYDVVGPPRTYGIRVAASF
jgi:iron complex outermembrane receptor protein